MEEDEIDEYYEMKTFYSVGKYQEVLNEVPNVAESLTRDILYFKACIALRKYGEVLSKLNADHSSVELVSLYHWATFLATPDAGSRRRSMEAMAALRESHP